MASPRLYVGNLPYVAQMHDVQMLFSENDIPIKNVDISIDPFTGRNPSYCFVDFDTEDDAVRALATIQGQAVRGRPVKINFKTAKRDAVGDRTNTSPWRAQPWKREEDNTGPYAFDRWSRQDAQDHWTAPVNEGRRVYVGGLPRIPHQSTVNIEVRKAFEAFAVEAVSKLIYPHETTKSKPGNHCYCFVDFPTTSMAHEAALALNGRPTPYGGAYRVSVTHRLPGKVMREQLGGVWPGFNPETRERNIRGNWRD